MSNESAHLDPAIRSLLSRLRFRIRAYVLLEGLFLALIWVGVTFWIGLAVDYLPILTGSSEMPRTARMVLLAVIGLGVAYVLYYWVLRRLFARLGDRSMALLLERRFRDLETGLVTSVEMSETEGRAEDYDPEMLEQTRQELLAKAEQVQVGEVFESGPLVVSFLVASVLMGTIAVFAALNYPAWEIWTQRLYLLKDRAWPRSALIEVVGIEQQTANGELLPLMDFQDRSLKVAKNANLRVRVRAARSAAVTPDYCTIYYRALDERGGLRKRGRANMIKVKAADEDYAYYMFAGPPFKGIDTRIQFDVVGYDYRVSDYEVQIVNSPALLKVELDCRYPKYIQQEDREPITWAAGVQLPQGSNVTVRAYASKDLKRVEWSIKELDQSGVTEITAEGDDARLFTCEIPSLDETVTLTANLFDRDGVMSENPQQIRIKAATDEPPQVEMALRGIGSAVTPDVVLPWEGKIVDDYAVKQSWIEIQQTPAGSVIPQRFRNLFTIGKQGESQARVDFRLQRNQPDGPQLKPGDRLVVSAMADDNYDLSSDPHQGAGDSYELEVVSAEDLVAMLEARELGLRRRFEQIIEEMTQTRDMLVRVRVSDAKTGAGAEPEDRLVEPGEKKEKKDPVKQAERDQTLRLLRTQQSLQQARKSMQELGGVAGAFYEIRDELTNNRIDSQDRKERIENKVAAPIKTIADEMFPDLDERLSRLEKELLDDIDQQLYNLKIGDEAARLSVEKTDEILVQMNEVLQQMLDLEDFNEMLEIVRSMIKQQEKLITDTQKAKEQDILGGILDDDEE